MRNELNEEERGIPGSATLSVNNIGGIDKTEVTFQEGVTILAGRNATNRTSLLQGLMAALGSDHASLKADADEGYATLEFGDETYRRTLERRNGTVATDGDPYLEDPELADLFAFLLETNEARQAVARSDDLQELIMRPVDTDEIQTEIERLERHKREIDDQLEELDELETRLPDLEAKRKRVTDEIESLEKELETAQAELEEANVDIEEHREEQSKLEEQLEELHETRSELERVRDRIETERESIDALEDEHEEVQERLESLSIDDEDIGHIEAEIESFQEEKADLSDEISQLQSTIQFNKQLLNEEESVLPESDGDTEPESDGSITDQLVADEETVTCWTCGSSVAREQIETTVDQLQDIRQQRLEERSEISSELEEHRETLSAINENRTEYRQAQRRLDSIDDEIERRHDRIDDLTADREALTSEIDDLEDEIDDLESPNQSDVLDQHKEVNQLKFQLERKERERDEIDDKIADIERRLNEHDDLEMRREDVTDELTDLRTRIDQIEETAVENFNEHMENLLEVLEYENLDRIWIDRTTREVRESRRKVTKSSFDLKIIRSTDSGAAYEDTITHLSESEREVTGLVFALAGYLVHDVYETVPFMLLDSLEAIDSERIATLLEYFDSHVPYLVVALLHEDAQAVEEDTQITEI